MNLILPSSLWSYGLLLIFFSPFLAQAGMEDFEYTIADNAVTITGYIGADGDVVIPEMIEGFPVVSLGEEAFSKNSKLLNISIPSGVTLLGDGVFMGCLKLESVSIPESVAEIGEFAFAGCEVLQNILLPSGIASIQDSTFSGCSSLTAIVIPDGVTSIGYSAFSGCSGLSYISIPSSVVRIEGYAFLACRGLSSVTVGSAVSSIGINAFSACPELRSIYFERNAPNLDGSDLFTEAENLTVYYFSDTIGWTNLFAGRATALFPFTYETNGNEQTITGYTGTAEKLSIPEMIEGLPVVALGEGFSLVNSKLREIMIPATVTTIDENIFHHGHSLAAIHVDDDNVAFSSLEGVLFNKDKTELIYYPRMKPELVYSVPDGVTHIGDYAFASNNLIFDVTIPDSVTDLGFGLFNGNRNLTSVRIGDGVTRIEGGLFAYCAVKHIVMGEKVTKIDGGAFFYCDLVGVYFKGHAPTEVENNVFNEARNVTVYYLDGKTGWSDTLAQRPAVAVYSFFEGWGGYPERVDGFINTRDWLGWLKQPDVNRNWFYAYSLSNWIYFAAPDDAGGWAYLKK